MSNTYQGGTIAVSAGGTTVTTGAASARATLPVDLSGENPRYVRVTATGESYVRIGDASVVATANDMLIQPADGVIVATHGATNIAYIQGAAVAKVNVVPLENV